MTIKEIRADKEISDKFVAYFKEELELCGDYLIGNVSTDFILSVFERQGYWSGVYHNYYYDEKTEEITTYKRSY